MEGLSFDNILTDNDINNLFVEENDTAEESNKDESTEDNKQEDSKSDTPAEVNTEELFSDEPESVSSDEDSGKETPDSENQGSSPIYSSIAKALKEEGVFPDLEEDELKKIKDPQEFVEMFQNQVDKRLNYQQQRVVQALNANVQPDVIKYHEGILNYLYNLDENILSREDEESETIRKNIIYQDYKNRGFSDEKASKLTERAVENGTDIDDAIEALESNKQYYNNAYNKLIMEGKQKQQQFQQQRQMQAEQLKKSIMEDKKFFGDLEVDKGTRKQIYGNIASPYYRDPQTGVQLTAIQKYQKDNPVDFLKNVSLIYTLTDGFRKMDKLVKNKVKKEMSKGMKELEESLFNSNVTGGNLSFASGVSDDSSQSLWKNFDLDI